MSQDVRSELARLPQLDALLQRPDVVGAISRYGRGVVASTLREQIAAARERIRAGHEVPAEEELITAAETRLAARHSGRLTRVINATGVVLHTNLGRAPLSAAAREAVLAATGYTTVEFDLATGRRGSRTASLGELAAEVSGTPAATVVNNGAAALLLVLAALASDHETIVSRGELIEIGGSYRLPDVMELSGSRLVEVGTTNRTNVTDYANAVTEATAMLLKVHRSNFSISGFTAEATIGELVRVGGEHGIPVVYDVGSGLVRDTDEGPLASEPSVELAVTGGANLVVYSGDKLLGGPQAGIIAGDEDLVRRCTTHPLARALRVDKLQRAALEATLEAHLRAEVPVDVPTVAMLHLDAEVLRERAEAVAEAIGPDARPIELASIIGGGALPGTELPSWGVTMPASDPDTFAARLRSGATPVIGRIDTSAVVLDLRTVPPSQDDELAGLVRDARG